MWTEEKHYCGRVTIKHENPLFSVLIIQGDSRWAIVMGDYRDHLPLTCDKDEVIAYAKGLLRERLFTLANSIV